MAFSNATEYFANLQSKLADSDKLEGFSASFQFNISGDEGGTWAVAIVDGKGTVTEGETPADCTLTVAANDWLQIINGELNPQMALDRKSVV